MRRLGTAEGLVIGLAGAMLFAVLCTPVLTHARQHDFLSLYTGGLLLRTDAAHLYDPATHEKVQRELVPDLTLVCPVVRPAFSLPAYMPLTWLPLKQAFAVWLTLGILAAFGIWYWAFRRFGAEALVYCSLFIPLGFGIAHGQDVAFITGLVILAYTAAEKGRKVLCGILLAALLCKFNLFLLMPVVLLWRREWRILAGYVAGALAAILASVLIASPVAYLALLRNPSLAAVDPSPEMMMNLHSLTVNFGVDSLFLVILLSLLVAACVLLIPRPAPLDRWFWAAIAGGLLISPHTFSYDAALLLAPILKIVCDSREALPVRLIAATAVTPFPYFMTMLPMPWSAGPAVLMTLLLLAIAWPAWFAGMLPAPSLSPKTSTEQA